MKIYGTWDAFLVEQLKEEEDVSGYLDAVIEEYHVHGNLAIVQLALQSVIEAQGGISELAKKINIEPQILSEVLDRTKVAKIDKFRTVLNAFGCQLSVAPLSVTNPHFEDATDVPDIPLRQIKKTFLPDSLASCHPNIPIIELNTSSNHPKSYYIDNLSFQ